MIPENKVFIAGNVTRRELKYLENGAAVFNFGVAINDKYKDRNGEWVETVTYVDVSCWGKTAEIADEQIGKGDPVVVTGKLKLESWKDKEGNERSKLKVQATAIYPLVRKPKDVSAPQEQQQPGGEEDVPF